MYNLLGEIDVKPVLKWGGGKRELIPEIRKYYKNLTPKKYIEPFFGGGSVYFDILKTLGVTLKENSIINDFNTDLIDMYKNIKINPDKVIYFCKELEKIYYEKDYYHIRDHFNGFNKDKKPLKRYEGVIRSSCLILLNRTCFNGLYRINSKGLFNVPKGRYKNPRIIDEDNLYKLSELLPNIDNIRNGEFYDIGEVESGDLVYFDPPYHPLNETSSFTSYSSSFGVEEQLKLRDYFASLSNKGVHVILSNSSSDFIKEIYKDFKIVKVYCSRNINSKSSKRGKIPEYLVLGSTFI